MSSSNRFAWERAVMGSDLLPTTRLVLLTLATHMDNDTRQARIGQPALADECNVTERAVRKHLTLAIGAGWLERVQRGHRISDEVVVASLYEGRFADPTGTDAQVGEGTQPEPDDTLDPTQPEHDDTQPEQIDHPTGTTVPPITLAHSENTASQQAARDPEEERAIDLEVRRQIREKKARGEPIQNEKGLAKHIRADVIRNRELDAELDHQAERQIKAKRLTHYRSAVCLGRNMASTDFTEREVRDAAERDTFIRGNETLIEAAVDAWRNARARAEAEPKEAYS